MGEATSGVRMPGAVRTRGIRTACSGACYSLSDGVMSAALSL